MGEQGRWFKAYHFCLLLCPPSHTKQVKFERKGKVFRKNKEGTKNVMSLSMRFNYQTQQEYMKGKNTKCLWPVREHFPLYLCVNYNWWWWGRWESWESMQLLFPWAKQGARSIILPSHLHLTPDSESLCNAATSRVGVIFLESEREKKKYSHFPHIFSLWS